jgi:predicted transcriptional regulator
MNYHQLLNRLHEQEKKGILHFDSLYVATVESRKVKDVSRDLGRLYRMGFLKRKKQKRICPSKHGRLCYKGFHFAYSFSSQGWKYLEYMSGIELLEAASYYDTFDKLSCHLSDDLKKRITDSIFLREKGRYKGPSRRLQALGILNLALPELIENIEKNEAEADRLQKDKIELISTIRNNSDVIGSQARRIKQLEDENTSLSSDLVRTRKAFMDIVQDMIKSSGIAFRSDMADLEQIGAWSSLVQFYGGIAKDLSSLLIAAKPEAQKLIEIIYDRQKPLITEAKEQLDRAKQMLKQP